MIQSNLPHPSSSHWYFSLGSQNTSQIENFHGSVTTAKHDGWCRTLGRATVSRSQNQPLTADHIYIWLVIAPHVSDRSCYNGGLAPRSHSEGLKRPQHPSAVNTLMGIPLLLIRSIKQESAHVGVKPRRTEGIFSRMPLQGMSTIRLILSLTQWCCPRLAERAAQFSPKGTSIKNNKCCPKPLMKWSQQAFQFISWKWFCNFGTPPPQSTSPGKRKGPGRLHQAGRMGSRPTAANCLMTGLLCEWLSSVRGGCFPVCPWQLKLCGRIATLQIQGISRSFAFRHFEWWVLLQRADSDLEAQGGLSMSNQENPFNFKIQLEVWLCTVNNRGFPGSAINGQWSWMFISLFLQ